MLVLFLAVYLFLKILLVYIYCIFKLMEGDIFLNFVITIGKDTARLLPSSVVNITA